MFVYLFYFIIDFSKWHLSDYICYHIILVYFIINGILGNTDFFYNFDIFSHRELNKKIRNFILILLKIWW